MGRDPNTSANWSKVQKSLVRDKLIPGKPQKLNRTASNSSIASTPRGYDTKQERSTTMDSLASYASAASVASSKASKEGGAPPTSPKDKKTSPKSGAAAKDLSPQAIEERRSAAARGELCVVHPPPPLQADLISFGDALFAKLFCGPAIGETQSEAGRKGGGLAKNGSASSARASPRPSDADKFVPPVPSRERASCCLDNEREALAKDLNVCGGRLDRQNLTP